MSADKFGTVFTPSPAADVIKRGELVTGTFEAGSQITFKWQKVWGKKPVYEVIAGTILKTGESWIFIN